MKKLVFGVAIALGLASGIARAAVLENGNGESCATAGFYHFVNNQTNGPIGGSLTAIFDVNGTTVSVTVGPSLVNKNATHYEVTQEGTLVSAESTLGGRLVLSDFDCGDDKKDPDPK